MFTRCNDLFQCDLAANRHVATSMPAPPDSEEMRECRRFFGDGKRDSSAGPASKPSQVRYEPGATNGVMVGKPPVHAGFPWPGIPARHCRQTVTLRPEEWEVGRSTRHRGLASAANEKLIRQKQQEFLVASRPTEDGAGNEVSVGDATVNRVEYVVKRHLGLLTPIESGDITAMKAVNHGVDPAGARTTHPFPEFFRTTAPSGRRSLLLWRPQGRATLAPR